MKGDLTAVQIGIWNAGEEPIRHEDILKPIWLFPSNHCRILKATINDSFRPREETRFRLDTSDTTNGVLALDWWILEKDDFAVIQILYEGKPDVPFQMSGTVVGQRRIGGGNPPPIAAKVKTASLELLASACSVMFFVMSKAELENRTKNTKPILSKLISAVGLLLILASGIAFLLLLGSLSSIKFQ